jgi:hypothetical protein
MKGRESWSMDRTWIAATLESRNRRERSGRANVSRTLTQIVTATAGATAEESVECAMEALA